MSTLYFEKISKLDRELEPVSVSIPLGRGRLAPSQHLVIYDGERTLPTHQRVLARWDDESAKWLLIHFQPDLPGNRDKTLHFSIEEGVDAAPPPMAAVTVQESAEGMVVNTGPLSFTIPREGFLPVRDVQLNGTKLWDESPFQGFALRCSGKTATSALGPVELTVEEAGPLRAVVLLRGKHRTTEGQEFIELRGRVTAYAGKPYIEVEHQFIHAEEEPELALEALQFVFRSVAQGTPRLALGEGYYRTAIQQGEQPLEMALTVETMLYQSNEHFIDSFYGDFWVDWRDEQAGLTLSVHQAHQNFPKTLRVEPEGIVCSLYPDDAEHAPLLQGMAKTHRLQLHFHAPDTPIEECSVRSLQFQLPDRPSLPRSWFRDNNPWVETFFPEQLPGRLITFFNELHDSRPKALGMFHFGDAPDANYTNQGRGRGENVWVNNEYDRPHCCALYYGLTGQRRVLDSALVCARHWLDVDLCHYSPDPLLHGGLKIHTRYHVTGRVTPSHEWTEGFLDYYFLTGRTEGLDGARSVGDNIMRHMARPEMRQPGDAAVREGGWALRAMVGLYLGTGEERWRAEAKRLVEMFLLWRDTYGALLAPYTSHSMPRVPFMISLTVNSFSRYLLIEDDERVKRLIVEVVDDLLEHCLGADGIFFYKELPSLQRTAPTPHALEALTHAYRITNDDRYLRIAARQFAALAEQPIGAGPAAKYLDASGAVIAGRGGGRIFADKYISILLFAGAASPAGLLDWYEYPFLSTSILTSTH
ncbi:MAG: hypothetical protein IT328_24960 [Caldilineaceae bacterium]|nr:hypothetical protein [Caldilineaceae bacterium]